MALCIWLAGTYLEVREYPQDLMESVECCHIPLLSRCFISSLLLKTNLQLHSQRYHAIVCLECAVLFLLFVLPCISCLPRFFQFNLCRRICMYVVVDLFNNSSVVESFTVARHCISFLQRIHSHKPLSFTSIFVNTYMYPSLTSFL